MANRFGVRYQPGEVDSAKWPGYILQPSGRLRKSYEWTNPRGGRRHYSRYFFEKTCATCGREHLVDWSNTKKQRLFTCSKKCWGIAHSSPAGHTKPKRGGEPDSHVMVKCPQHPASKKGYVPQHRLIVEQEIGRYLTEDEIVHHINCIKSDNAPKNLVVCADSTEHFKAHGSLNACVAALIDAGLIGFDRATMSYHVTAKAVAANDSELATDSIGLQA